MSNWDRHLGEHYMARTIYDATTMFADALKADPPAVEPLCFKVYRNVRRFPLRQRLPLSLGDARWSFDDFVQRAPGGRPSASTLDVQQLSTLLYYAFGFSRLDKGPSAPWPYHRLVPSARCLYPTELYVWVPAAGELDAGIYHYDSLHHMLAQVRLGDVGEELSSVLGAGLDRAQGVLFISTLVWKNAYKYREYAYRLCTQEAGMVIGNALMVAGPLGLRGTVHYQFLDEQLARLLGLDVAEEHALAAVPLYAASDAPTGVRKPCEPASTHPGRLARIARVAHEIAGAEGDGDLPELVTRIVRASRLSEVREFTTENTDSTSAPCLRCVEVPVRRMPSAPAEGLLELAQGLRARTSGNVLFNPRAETLQAEDFWEICRYATAPYACDRRDQTTRPSVVLYVVAMRVAELPVGVYRFCEVHRGLHRIAEGDFSRPLQGAMEVPNINLCASMMVLYLAADYPAASRVFGNRAYRMLSMECGLVAQRICVMSGMFDLAARIHNGYRAEVVERVLDIADADLTPFFQIAIARNRPGVQYSLPILF